VNRVSKLSLAAVSLALVLLGGAGCGYSLTGRGSFLPSYIKVISVPQFKNNTPIFEIERTLTEHVRAELIGRGRYKIESDLSRPHDAVLTGEIIHIGIGPAAFDQNQRATQIVISVVTKLEFRDLKTDKVLWSHPALPISERYDVTTSTDISSAGTFLGQNTNAVQRISTEFARAVVSAILESF
jgi:lipopolysaccharide assembly LptE-like protein